MTASTPCVKLCVFDDASGLCRGCGRTLQEIAQWASWSEAKRRHVMRGLSGRLVSPIEARSRRPTEPPADPASDPGEQWLPR